MSIDLGFETIGNATCTVYDGSNPILTTDPWVIGIYDADMVWHD